MDPGDFPAALKKTLRSLSAYKGHFTRTLRSCERLANFTPTAPTLATAQNLQASLDKLEDIFEKLHECVIEVQQECDDDDYLETLELDEYLANTQEKYGTTKELLLTAINDAGVRPRQPLAQNTRRTSDGNASGAGDAHKKLNVNKSLKPFTLLPSHNPTEFKSWARLFKGFYRSSNLELLEKADQQLYLQSCLDPNIWARVEGKVDDDTPIFDDAGTTGCLSVLIDDFQERWPLFNHRMAFFTSEQGQGQDMSTWVSELEQLAEQAEIEDITLEDILIFRILGGATNFRIREELAKLSEPTLKDYKKKIVEMEVSKRMVGSCLLYTSPSPRDRG